MLRALFGGLLKVLFVSAGLVLIAAAILRVFFVDLAVVGHYAMAPTLTAGEQVLAWRSAELEIGDVALCEHPQRPGEHVMGRVVALAGMTVDDGRDSHLEIDGEAMPLHIDGTRQLRDTLEGTMHTFRYGVEQLHTTEHLVFLPLRKGFAMHGTRVEGGLFLLGDNRTRHPNDSRSFGPVDPDGCIGQIVLRLQPGHPTGDDIRHGWLEPID